MNGANDSEPSVRAGVVGVGSMGSHHARVYRELPNVDLVGVADDADDRAAAVAEEYRTRARSVDDLLETADVVSVAVPTRFHHDVATRALERDVDVLVEKPLARDPAEARDLVARAERADAVLQVGHVERFNPAVSALADIAPELDLVAVDARRLGPPLDRDVGDGVALDLMIHDIDVLLSLVDSEVESVDAVGAAGGRYVAAHVAFDDGVVATLTASRVTQKKVRELSVTARSCQVSVDYIEQALQVHRHSTPEYVERAGDVRYRNESVVERPMVESGEPLKRELEAFVDASRTGEEPVVSGEEGLRALELAREVAQAAREPERQPEVNLP